MENIIKDRKIILMKYSIILFILSLSLIFLFYGHKIWGGVVAISLLVIISFIISEIEILHPLTWFPPFFLLYSISHPVLKHVEQPGVYPFLEETLLLEWIALFTFILFNLGIKQKEYEFKMEETSNLSLFAKPIYIISIVMTALYMIYVYTNGLTTKYLISLDDSPLGVLTIFYRILNVSFILLLAHSMIRKRKIPKGLILFTVLYTFITVLILGERDTFLRIILISIVAYNVFYKKISKTKLIIISLLGLLLVPLMGEFKNAAVAGELKETKDRNIVLNVMGSEFAAASRNLNNLLIQEDSWEYLYGKSFYWDAKAVLKLGKSTVAQYNEKFYPDLVLRGGGNGFSLVGEGLINFGVYGIIFVFAFLALTLRYMYYKSHYNLKWLTIYIIAIPIVIYVNRADLANYISQVIKHGFIPILLVYIAKHIIEGISKRE